jgi:hypothetical protein
MPQVFRTPVGWSQATAFDIFIIVILSDSEGSIGYALAKRCFTAFSMTMLFLNYY